LGVVYNIPKKINSNAIPLKAFCLGKSHLLCRWSFTSLINNIIYILHQIFKIYSIISLIIKKCETFIFKYYIEPVSGFVLLFVIIQSFL